ncbi:MAG: hypothetical protein PHG82_03830 [Candidatus Gracilibacteria bacterium]|nr:hypothetical protein [Candidatus Gracilibacteria bacterium]
MTNKSTKLLAVIALLAIIGGVVSTGILVLYETLFPQKTATENTAPQSEKIDLSSLLKDSGAIISTGITK